jgi:murein DD-endopeptidase MepM/ murein hydrolase activator NlpD
MAAVARVASAGPTVPPGTVAPARSRWVWPLDRLVVVRPYDPPAVRWGAGHRGIDLAAAHGSVVRTAGAGVVAFAGAVAGRGVVSVQHGRWRTTYEPVVTTVATGAAVRAGEPIGTLAPVADGTGHCAPTPCLHLGLRAGPTYLDPMLLFRPARVRLLPLPGPVVLGATGGPAGPAASGAGRAAA